MRKRHVPVKTIPLRPFPRPTIRKLETAFVYYALGFLLIALARELSYFVRRPGVK